MIVQSGKEAITTQNAYITDYNSNTVSVIDTATNRVVATISAVGCRE